MSSLPTAIVVLGLLHAFIISASLWNLYSYPFTRNQKLAWSVLILLLPIVGVLVFHLKFKLGWFQDGPYELNTEEAVSRSDGGVGNTGIVRFRIDE